LLQALNAKGTLPKGGVEWEKYFYKHAQRCDEALNVPTGYAGSYDQAQATNFMGPIGHQIADR
jgi:hypothetical protein